MANNVVGLFDDQDAARRVIDELTNRGFARDRISVVAADQEGAFQRHSVQEDGNIAAEGAVTGLTSGAIVGGILGFLVGTGAIFIPGGVLAAGPIAGLITGAAAGAATGGILGGLIGMGIPKEHADVYAEGIRRGGVLVAVDPEGRNDEVESIMRDNGVIDIEERAQTYRSEGFTSYEGDKRPYTTEQAEEERRHPNPEGTGAAALGGDRMEGLNTNTMIPGNPPTGNDGIARGTMTTSYTGSAGSVGTGSIALPSGAMGTADDDMQSRKDHMNVTGDVPDIAEDSGDRTRGASFDNAYDQGNPPTNFGSDRNNNSVGTTGSVFIPAGTGVGMDEGGMASAGGTGTAGTYSAPDSAAGVPGTTPSQGTVGADVGGTGTMGEDVGRAPQTNFGTPGATDPTPTAAGTTGTMGSTANATNTTGSFGRAQESTDPTVLTTGAMGSSAAPMGTGAASTGYGANNTSGLPESGSNQDWGYAHMEDFREVYDRDFSHRGMTYEQAAPAYEFGHKAWHEGRYEGREWQDVEQKMRDDWERMNPGSWILYRDVVHAGWTRHMSRTGSGGAELL